MILEDILFADEEDLVVLAHGEDGGGAAASVVPAAKVDV